MASSVSNANTIVIFNKKMTVTSANNHGYNVGDQAYLKFLTGDRANTVNGYYTVTEVGDANSFNIVGANLVFAGGQTRVFGRSGTISVAGTNTFANGNTAYISFASGDQGNTTNGIYYPIVTGPNILSFNTAKPATANAYVRIWSSQNSYSNIKITTIRSSYFTPGTNVAIQFFASATDLANGIYSVNSSYFLSNSFNIVYLGNTSTYSFSGNTYSNNQIYTHDNTMSYIVYSGLGVTPLSQMEGTCQILLYK
jgi:hypothetical protein